MGAIDCGSHKLRRFDFGNARSALLEQPYIACTHTNLHDDENNKNTQYLLLTYMYVRLWKETSYVEL